MQLPLAELPELFVIVLAGMLLIFFLVLLTVFSVLVRPWLQALFSGEPVALFNILGMRLRGNPPSLLIDAYIVLKKRGFETSIAEVENIYIANKDRIRDFQDLIDRVQETETE